MTITLEFEGSIIRIKDDLKKYDDTIIRLPIYIIQNANKIKKLRLKIRKEDELIQEIENIYKSLEEERETVKKIIRDEIIPVLKENIKRMKQKHLKYSI